MNDLAVVDSFLVPEFRRMLLHESEQQAANEVEEPSIDRQMSLKSDGSGRMAGQPEMANPLRVVLVFASLKKMMAFVSSSNLLEKIVSQIKLILAKTAQLGIQLLGK